MFDLRWNGWRLASELRCDSTQRPCMFNTGNYEHNLFTECGRPSKGQLLTRLTLSPSSPISTTNSQLHWPERQEWKVSLAGGDHHILRWREGI